jgi:hypothetical protein
MMWDASLFLFVVAFFSFFFLFFSFFFVSFFLQILCGGQSKVFRFGTGTMVAEAVQEIKERVGSGDESFGLYQAKTKAATKQHARSRWLAMDKPLAVFALENGDELHFKSTNRPVKFAMPDGSVKTVMIDDSAVVEKIVDQMGEKLGLANSEEYGISTPLNGKDTWLQNRFTLQVGVVLLGLGFFFYFFDLGTTFGGSPGRAA